MGRIKTIQETMRSIVRAQGDLSQTLNMVASLDTEDGHRLYAAVLALKTPEMDVVFAKYIAARDGFTCVFCRRQPINHTSHMFGKTHGGGRYSIRWYPPDADGACWRCHADYENEKGFRNGAPLAYTAWKIKQLGREGYVALAQRAQLVMREKEARFELFAYFASIGWEVK